MKKKYHKEFQSFHGSKVNESHIIVRLFILFISVLFTRFHHQSFGTHYSSIFHVSSSSSKEQKLKESHLLTCTLTK